MSVVTPSKRSSLVVFILQQKGVFSPAHVCSKAAKRGIRVSISFVTDTLARMESAGLVKTSNRYFSVVR